MKWVMVAMVVVLFFWGGALPQSQKGAIELSTSSSFWSVKEEGKDKSDNLVNIPVRLGYFVTAKLEIEPEILLTISDEDGDNQMGLAFMGNLSYNFLTKDKVTPFFLVGVGFGNAMNTFSFAIDQETGIIALNIGAGLKSFINSSVAFRSEYRFTHYSGEMGGYYYSFSHRDRDVNIHSILMGFSIFFK